MDQEHNDLGNGAPQGTDESTHAKGQPEKDHRWLRSVVENSSEIVTIVDPDGALRYANPAWERALGYDPDRAIGTMNVLDHVHPEDLGHVLEETEEAFAEGGITTSEAEYRFRHSDGSWRWMESVGTYLLDDPAVGGVVVVSRDVTEHKQAEEQLRFQAQLLGAVGEAVIALDVDGKVAYWNRAAEVLYGWSSEEAMGRKLREMVVPKDLRAQAEKIETQVREDGSWSGEFLVRRRDGTIFPVEATNTPVFGEDGNLRFIIGVLRDIAERKKVEEALRRSEERFRLLAENAKDLIFRYRFKPTPGFEYISPSATAITGYTPAEYYADPELGLKIVHAEDRHLLNDVPGSAEFPITLRWLRKDGTIVWAEQRNRPFYDEAGELVAIEGIIRDITERKKAEERYRTLVEHIPAVTYVQQPTASGAVTYVSPQMKDLLGYEPEEYTSHPEHWRNIIHPEDRERVLAEDRRINETGEPFFMEYRQFTKDGSVVWVRDEAALVRDEDGEPLYWLGVQTDVTERKQAEERLKHQAFHDSLTDLPNRRLFVDCLEQALGRTPGRKGERKVAVLYLDLNNFKIVNDSLGHEVGDRLLVALGERLGGCLRPEDTLSRFGGDEFTVLVEDIGDPVDAIRVAEWIVETLREPLMVEGREISLKPSVGIALGAAGQTTVHNLLRDADTAMYRAKERGQDYAVFEPAMYEQALRRLKLEADLRRAIGEEEFVVHYQPIVDLQTGEVWGVEALVRWDHPEEESLLAPSQFIPVAEEAGLVVPIGRWVLEEACRQGLRWQREHPHLPPLVVSVNLSVKQLQHRDVLETIEEVLEKTGFEASRLSLDITESVYIEILEHNAAALDRIKRMRVRISIDDFGMGYSSLSYLKRLPADTLKIDKSFVAGMGENVEDTAIVGMVIELAHTLGMRVIAEGVESEVQVEQLKEMGCDRAQGYHFARPLPPGDVPEFLAE